MRRASPLLFFFFFFFSFFFWCPMVPPASNSHGLTQFLQFACVTQRSIAFKQVNNQRPPSVLPFPVLQTIGGSIGVTGLTLVQTCWTVFKEVVWDHPDVSGSTSNTKITMYNNAALAQGTCLSRVEVQMLMLFILVGAVRVEGLQDNYGFWFWRHFELFKCGRILNSHNPRILHNLLWRRFEKDWDYGKDYGLEINCRSLILTPSFGVGQSRIGLCLLWLPRHLVGDQDYYPPAATGWLFRHAVPGGYIIMVAVAVAAAFLSRGSLATIFRRTSMQKAILESRIQFTTFLKVISEEWYETINNSGG
ncbi:hypothetical protein B0H19DRAFT_1060408 [Mycena capillaripes]|nr:hypothetical protein B0H19DRAFT_1060408 [Mycena capillaripes]